MKSSNLDKWIENYLLWMIDQDYSMRTLESHRGVLKHFKVYAVTKGWTSQQAVSRENRVLFLYECSLAKASAAMNGFSRYLGEIGIIEKSIDYNQPCKLPEVFEHYLAWHKKTSQTKESRRKRIRKILCDFNAWLEKSNIQLNKLKIDHVDNFLKKRNQGLAPGTISDNRSIVKGFLRYIYLEKNILKRDLASMIVSAPVFAYDNPPKYLRKNEIKQLFDSMDLSCNDGIRIHAMAMLAYTTGLRPGEIANIKLDDISFEKGELTVPERKGLNPICFPLPERAVKAIAAYVIGARPKIGVRRLFLSLSPPYKPVTGGMAADALTRAMRKAEVPGTSYWLRHTYAQNLLESGASLFEIKEMMGHDCIKATKKYLHINIKLMREVLFDD